MIVKTFVPKIFHSNNKCNTYIKHFIIDLHFPLLYYFVAWCNAINFTNGRVSYSPPCVNGSSCKIGTQATFSCGSEYRLSRNSPVRCLGYNLWGPPILACEGKSKCLTSVVDLGFGWRKKMNSKLSLVEIILSAFLHHFIIWGRASSDPCLPRSLHVT